MRFDQTEIQSLYDDLTTNISHCFALQREGVSVAGFLDVIQEMVDSLHSVAISQHEEIWELENTDTEDLYLD